MSKIRTQEQYKKCPTCTGAFTPRELSRHKCKGFKQFKLRKRKKK